MNKKNHVYCTNCIHGEKLIQCLLEDEAVPTICVECFPFNPEDSVPFEQRPNYIEKN